MKAKPAQHPGEVVLELNRRDEAMLDRSSRHSSASLFRLKRILVPIDFSDCARKALQYALALAQEHAASLTLLYALPPIHTVSEIEIPDYITYQTSMQAAREKELAQWIVDEVRGLVPVEGLVRPGAADLEILATAKKIEADLIVIATHGRTGLKRAVLGSVTEHVVRRAPCPVLVVREREHEFLAQPSKDNT